MSEKTMRYWRVRVERWVRPLFRKSRRKEFVLTYAAWDTDSLYRLIRNTATDERWKRWKTLSVVELTPTIVASERKMSEEPAN